MSRVHCTNCGRDGHAKWQCTRPTESEIGRKTDADRPLGRLPPKSASNDRSGRSQTNNPSSRKGSGVESLRSKGLASPAKVRDAETANTKDAAKFDKVAYQRVYMAKWRAEIKSGKRVPQRKGETT